jgi:hypothetical protein
MHLRILLMVAVSTTVGFSLSHERQTGHTLTIAEARQAFGGYEGLTGTTNDAECSPALQCEPYFPDIVCDDYSFGSGCAGAEEKVDAYSGDLPMSCAADAPGQTCELSQLYVCATVYSCQQSPYTGICETDFTDVLQVVWAASVCESGSQQQGP